MNAKRRSEQGNIQIRLIAELMKNSHRSDRELARVLRTSQPTVTRTRVKLEREGIIKEYTIIPDFARLGYQIMGVSFIRTREPGDKKESEKLRKVVTEVEKNNPLASLLAVKGEGMKKDRMFVAFYKNFAAYTMSMELVSSLPYVDVDSLDSFLVDLNDKSNYRDLTFRRIASDIG